MAFLEDETRPDLGRPEEAPPSASGGPPEEVAGPFLTDPEAPRYAYPHEVAGPFLDNPQIPRYDYEDVSPWVGSAPFYNPPADNSFANYARELYGPQFPTEPAVASGLAPDAPFQGPPAGVWPSEPAPREGVTTLDPAIHGSYYADLFKALGGYVPPYIETTPERLAEVGGAAYQDRGPDNLPAVYGPPGGMPPNTIAHEWGHAAGMLNAQQLAPGSYDWRPVYPENLPLYQMQGELMRRRGVDPWARDWREQEADLLAHFPHAAYPVYYDPNATNRSTNPFESPYTGPPDPNQPPVSGPMPAPGGVVGGPPNIAEDATLANLGIGIPGGAAPAPGWEAGNWADDYWNRLWAAGLTGTPVASPQYGSVRDASPNAVFYPSVNDWGPAGSPPPPGYGPGSYWSPFTGGWVERYWDPGRRGWVTPR